jgi:hypothetical protein
VAASSTVKSPAVVEKASVGSGAGDMAGFPWRVWSGSAPALGHALVAGRIGVRDYVSVSLRRKACADRGTLGGAVFEQQAAALQQVSGRGVDQGVQVRERIATGGERRPRLVTQ